MNQLFMFESDRKKEKQNKHTISNTKRPSNKWQKLEMRPSILRYIRIYTEHYFVKENVSSFLRIYIHLLSHVNDTVCPSRNCHIKYNNIYVDIIIFYFSLMFFSWLFKVYRLTLVSQFSLLSTWSLNRRSVQLSIEDIYDIQEKRLL